MHAVKWYTVRNAMNEDWRVYSVHEYKHVDYTAETRISSNFPELEKHKWKKKSTWGELFNIGLRKHQHRTLKKILDRQNYQSCVRENKYGKPKYIELDELYTSKAKEGNYLQRRLAIKINQKPTTCILNGLVHTT